MDTVICTRVLLLFQQITGIDPNWETYESGDFEFFNEYSIINEANTPVRDLTVKYVLENTSKNLIEKEKTFVIVCCTFIPRYFSNSDGTLKDETEDFERVVTFWTVSTNNSTTKYFNTPEEAKDYFDSAVTSNSSPKMQGPYWDGNCYYSLFLNPKGNYNIIRNSFYRATITQITPPGRPTPGTENPETPIVTNTDLQVSIDIQPWAMVSDDYHLE